VKAPKGTFDLLPDQQAGRERVASAVRRILEGASSAPPPRRLKLK